VSEKLIVWQEVAVIREQLQFLRQRMQQPLLPGVVQQVDTCADSLRVLENLTRQYYERRASDDIH
jgi:hypothetical protein